MKYLSEYIEVKTDKLYEKTGAFYAFGQKQYDEKAKDGVDYVSLGCGLICPKENAQLFNEEYDRIIKESIAEDIADNGKEAIIKRELNNYECYYTGNIGECVDSLKDYGYTKDEIRKIFNATNWDDKL
jgi:hypothetical protein